MTRPPEHLRARTLAGLALCRTPAPPTAAFAAPYAHAVAGLDALLRDLTRAEWATPVVHGWDVHGTVAHLMAGDGLLCAGAGTPEAVHVPKAARGDWGARTRYVVAVENARSPHATWGSWHSQAAALLDSDAARHHRDIHLEFAGRHVLLADAYLARGFETWLHTDDIGRAVGRRVPDPEPETMPALVGLGTATLACTYPTPPAATTLTLTGPGATTTTLGTGVSTAEVTMTTVDFCRLLGGNRRAENLTIGTDGDPESATWLLQAIASLAIL
ncbi:maleylpyruvate isomerase family mycothiol-dependent enzyme [Yinghuangia seranimata]|uniref:maleylpyruvate isomerase family mycothiol-dependent enzyme n=1 Tax=Yinghuangia seranimata TaxID=408067 RepID=UPI00248B8563|nr:maleylpyruvate isomerase family mycothiol-dependent enzyme [Yinghuangia seranimata]MDI2128223.1 maleylpyruvate isomerase family mycothiol-dependent enzyme [Yinghuangia seranimata]